jgi:MFS family permease
MDAERARARDVMRERDAGALLASDGLSSLGDQVARLAVALLVLERTGSPLAASATYALSYLSWVFGGPLLAGFADRYPRRGVMIASDVARAVLVCGLALPGIPLAALFAVLGAIGLLTPPNDAARSALLAHLLTGERYVVANALNNIVSQAGQVSGFLLGGALVSAIGIKGALLVNAVSFALSALVLLLVREVGFRPGPDGGTSLIGETAAGVRLVLGDRRLRRLLLWGLLTAASVIATEGLAVAVVEAQDGTALMAGVLTGAAPAGFLIGSWLLLRVPPGRREGLFPALVVLSCAPLLLTPVVHDLRALAVVWGVAGAGNALQLVANSAFVRAVPPEMRGRAFGFAAAALFAVQGLVLLGAGAVAEATGPRAAVALSAALCLLLLPPLLLVGRDLGPQGRARSRRSAVG